MPGTVKSELLSDADRSHKCDSQEKVCWIRHLSLDKSHFITGDRYCSEDMLNFFKLLRAARVSERKYINLTRSFAHLLFSLGITNKKDVKSQVLICGLTPFFTI